MHVMTTIFLLSHIKDSSSSSSSFLLLFILNKSHYETHLPCEQLDILPLVFRDYIHTYDTILGITYTSFVEYIHEDKARQSNHCLVYTNNLGCDLPVSWRDNVAMQADKSCHHPIHCLNNILLSPSDRHIMTIASLTNC